MLIALLAMVGILPAAKADRALLVGINAYATEHPDPPPSCSKPCLVVGPLHGAVADVNIARSLLIDMLGYRAEDIRVITDRDATASRILAEIDQWLVKGTKPGDRAFFHYSGHGVQAPDDGGDEADGFDEAIVPVDFRFLKGGKVENLIRDDQLQRALSGLKGRRFTAVFDSCHSGTVTRAAGLDDGAVQGRTPTALQQWLVSQTPSTRSPGATLGARAGESAVLDSEPGWTIWSAASANQVAWDTQAPLGGVFTRLLADEIRKGVRSGSSTHAAVLDRVQAASKRFCENLDKCNGLVPTLETPRNWLAAPLATSLLAQAEAPFTPTVLETATAVLPAGASNGDGHRLKITMRPGTSVQLGAKLQYDILSDVAGQLMIFDADPSGKLVQLFPNRFKPKARVTAGNPFTMPVGNHGFDLVAEEPLGRGRLIVVVSDGSVDFSDLAVPSKGLEEVAAPQDFLAEIAARLRKARPDGVGGVKLAAWAVGAVDYEVTR